MTGRLKININHFHFICTLYSKLWNYRTKGIFKYFISICHLQAGWLLLHDPIILKSFIKDLIVTNSVTCVQPNGYTSFVRVRLPPGFCSAYDLKYIYNNDFNKSISIYFVLIGISKGCKFNLTPSSLEQMYPLNTPVRDRRSSLMEIMLVFTHSHWWEKATPRT